MLTSWSSQLADETHKDQVKKNAMDQRKNDLALDVSLATNPRKAPPRRRSSVMLPTPSTGPNDKYGRNRAVYSPSESSASITSYSTGSVTSMGSEDSRFPQMHVKNALGLKYSPDVLEQILRDKISQKTVGGNGGMELRMAFKYFDTDGSGKITYPEFVSGLRRFNFVFPKKEMIRFVQRYDKNGDGLIDFNEFVNGLMPRDYSKNLNKSLSVARITHVRPNTLMAPNGNGRFGTERFRSGQERTRPDTLTRSSFEATLRDRLEQKLPSFTRWECKKALKHYDRLNSSSEVPYKPFFRAIQNYINCDEKRVKKIIKEYDVDNSKTINIDKFVSEVIIRKTPSSELKDGRK